MPEPAPLKTKLRELRIRSNRERSHNRPDVPQMLQVRNKIIMNGMQPGIINSHGGLRNHNSKIMKRERAAPGGMSQRDATEGAEFNHHGNGIEEVQYENVPPAR
ncbi:MAG: hypothetical protein JST22_01560 [Bacteroidetes bacterium]|nr:hypothetical protein [Bacteroidota bacterium]